MEDVECELSVSFDKPPLLLNEEELLGQVIYAGWADRVAKRIKGHSALSEGDRKVNEVRYQASWSEKRLACQVCWNFVHLFCPIADPKPYYEHMTDKVLCWISSTFGPHLLQLSLHSFPIKDVMN
ncbi:hypothetical protein LguiB_012908 [Lonicera macranthoides]